MRRMTIFVVLITICIGVAGCWNSVELDKRAIVVAAGIDKGDKEDDIKVTVEILKPGALGPLSKGGGGEESAVWVESSTGKTIFDAIRNFTKVVSRKLYWEQNRVIIFGQEYAKEGILPALNFFLRDSETRKRAWVMVSDEEASKVIETEGVLEKIPADTINDLILSTRATSTAAAIDLHHFSIRFMDEYEESYASHILIEEKEGKPHAALQGTAVFKQDKLVGWLDGTETRGLLWIIDKISSGIIIVELDEDGKKVSLEIIRSSTKLKPEIIDGQPVMLIDIREVSIVGDAESDEDMSDLEVLHNLEILAEDAIEKEVRACLAKAQKEFKADIFGFGTVIHRNRPREWKAYAENWDELFPDIEVEIDVTVKIDYVGFIKKIGTSK